MLDTVKVPKQFEPVFQKAQGFVRKYFSEKKEDASRGAIEISGERYILVRAASMSVDFFDTVKNLYKNEGEEEAINVARSILFDIAHAIGKADAKNFHKKMNLNEPIEKLSAGPIHFSHSGWAFVEIFPESKPSPDENYYLIYDHPFSFESDAWGKAARKSDFPVCVMNAGYSSGWCEESFGVTLVASEILCQAKGDEACRFIMAHPSKIAGYIREYLGREPELAKRVTGYEIPGFFKKKQMEEALRKAKEDLEITVEKRTSELRILNEQLKRDIAERKQAEEQIRRQKGFIERVINSLEDPFYVINPDYTIALANEAARKRGITEGGYCYELTHNTQKPCEGLDACSLKEVLRTGKPVRREHIHYDKEGNRAIIEVHADPIFDDTGRVVQVIESSRDISERKKAEEELKDYTEQIETANKELDDFTYIVSHDLKEPLRSMNAFSKFIEDDYKTKLDEEGRNYIKRIRANAARMQALIEDLLEISRIERRKSPYEEVQAEEIINEVKLILEYSIKQKNAEIIIRNELPRIFCDPVRIAEVFVNLISNAIKFNDKPDPRIEIGSSPEGIYHRFYVKDNGPGIEKQYFEKIFEIFQRLGKREEYEGTGAGLTIVKKIVEMHGGRAWVESEVGGGCVFYFTIPKEKRSISDKKKIGQILIERKLITETELKNALDKQEGQER
ncbi:MAG: ATP-binding protein [Candidatus Omnitrophota bacterium]